MTTLFALFIFSMLGMLGLAAFKAFELKVRKIRRLANMWNKGDLWIHSVLDKWLYSYNRSKKISKIFLFEFLPSYAYEILTKLKDYVYNRYYTVGDGFRGRRVLRADGSVSFFLQKIMDDKREVR